MAKLDTFINIKVDGTAAVRDLGQVEKAAKGVDDELDNVGDQGRLGGLSAGLETVKGKMQAIAGPAVVGAVVAGVGAAIDKTIELGIAASTVSTALDVSVEEASRLNAAFGDVGIEANDIVDIALQIQGGLEDNADLTERLGVNMADIASPVDAVRVGIDNWDFLSATERATLFGEEGVRQISRMVAEGQTFDQILAGVSDIRIISEQDAARAREMAASMAELKGFVEGVTLTVGGSMLEAFENIQAVTDKLPGDMDAAAIAAEGFTAALSPSLYTIGKIDEAVGFLASKFTGELDPAAQTVAESVLRAFEPVEEQLEDVGTTGVAAIEDVASEYDRLIGKLSDRNAFLNLQDSFDDVRDKGVEAFAAGVEGADNAEQSIRDYERAQNDLTADIGEYLTKVLEIPPEKATEIVLGYAGKTPEQVEADLQSLTRRRTIELLFQVPQVPRYIAAPGNSSVTNVTINPSRTMGPREIALIGQEWARFNG